MIPDTIVATRVHRLHNLIHMSLKSRGGGIPDDIFIFIPIFFLDFCFVLHFPFPTCSPSFYLFVCLLFIYLFMICIRMIFVLVVSARLSSLRFLGLSQSVSLSALLALSMMLEGLVSKRTPLPPIAVFVT